MANISTYLTPGKREDVRQGWVQLLSTHAWDWFVTLTYKDDRRPHDAGIVTKQAVGWLNRCIWDHATKVGDNIRLEGERYDAYGRIKRFAAPPHDEDLKIKNRGPFGKWWFKRSKKPIWVCGVEANRQGDLHAHMLVKHRVYGLMQKNEISRRDAWDLWFNKMDMGRARIEPPNASDAISTYVSKYVAKGVLTLSPTFEIGSYRKVVTCDQGRRPAG